MNSKFSYLNRYIIIGNSSTYLVIVEVGKTCLLKQFLEGTFNVNEQTSVGVEFGAKIVDIGEKKVKLQIWDTVGLILGSLGKKFSRVLPGRTTGGQLGLCLFTILPIDTRSTT